MKLSKIGCITLILILATLLSACNITVKEPNQETENIMAAKIFAEKYMEQLDYSDSQWDTCLNAVKKKGIKIGVVTSDGDLIQGKKAEEYLNYPCQCKKNDPLNKNERAWLDSWKSIMTKRCYRELVKDRQLPNTQMAMEDGYIWTVQSVEKADKPNTYYVNLLLEDDSGKQEKVNIKVWILKVKGNNKVNRADLSQVNQMFH